MTIGRTKVTVARRPSQRGQRFQLLLDELEDLAFQLRRHGPTLLDRAAIPVVDGFPRTASGAVHERGAIARLSDDVDDDGHREGVARPVEDLVIAGPQADPVADAVHDMRVHVIAALHSLRRADGARARAQYIPHDERPPERPVAPGCVNCVRYEIYAVAVKAGRCWACYQYRRRHDLRDAPADIVLARLENATPRQLAHRQESA